MTHLTETPNSELQFCEDLMPGEWQKNMSLEAVENKLCLNQEESAIHEQELLHVLKERLNKIVAEHNGQATDEIDQKVS